MLVSEEEGPVLSPIKSRIPPPPPPLPVDLAVESERDDFLGLELGSDFGVVVAADDASPDVVPPADSSDDASIG